jgi:hypothetical protein
VAYLDVHDPEYQASCACCKFFRSWPLDVPPRADHDGVVRAAVLDRLLDDGLNVERTRAALQRDFLLHVSENWWRKAMQVATAEQREQTPDAKAVA